MLFPFLKKVLRRLLFSRGTHRPDCRPQGP